MAKHTITINDDYEDIFEYQQEEQNLDSVEQVMTNLLEGWAKQKIEWLYQQKQTQAPPPQETDKIQQAKEFIALDRERRAKEKAEREKAAKAAESAAAPTEKKEK